MKPVKSPSLATIDEISKFDEIIDVRTPLEFAEDHIPGATNFPVLSNEERVRVGTLHKESSFEAKKIGAALIARNIAAHIESHCLDKPRNWRPLIYCWRGGQRSGSMTHILRSIGFSAMQLEGGYKNYRQHVLQQLSELPRQFSYRVICGLTGSGKSRLLQAMQTIGAQVLDLEDLANHRGSVLGNMPDKPQPAQKYYDSQILAKLQSFDPSLPVFVESESKKVGSLHVPETLIEQMWRSPCIRLEASTALRVALLLDDYRHFLDDPSSLQQQLAKLRGIYSNEQLDEWKTMHDTQQWEDFVADMLEKHYDPAYTRSINSHFAEYQRAPQLHLNSLDNQEFLRLAKEALAIAPNFDNNGAE